MTAAGASSVSARRGWLGAGWASALLLLAAVVVVAVHHVEEHALAQLLERARPRWLLAAALLQAATYFCTAIAWGRPLARAGAPQPLRALLPLALAKQFTDQALPSLGLSGNVVLVRGLERRGAPRPLAMAALLVDLVAFRVAYLVVLLAALAVLAWHRDLSTAQLVVAAVFTVVALAAPLAVLPLRHHLDRLPARVREFGPLRQLVDALAAAPPELLRDPLLLTTVTGCELGVFLLDAATLGTALLAVGAPARPDLVFACYVMAAVAGTLAIVPGGLGVFEGTAVAVLHLLGVPIAAALAATLLLRGFTFWMPMLPGLWLTQRETR
jgi:uncharacterized membrane protein YbhN (UPF0104 family)